MWLKVIKDEEEQEAAAAASATPSGDNDASTKDTVVVESVIDKMSMPLIREDSDERNSDDKAAIEEVQLKIIEEKKVATLATLASSTSSRNEDTDKPQVAVAKTAVDIVEDAPHERSVSDDTAGSSPSQEESTTEQIDGSHQSHDSTETAGVDT